jgi:hypothetical protein
MDIKGGARRPERRATTGRGARQTGRGRATSRILAALWVLTCGYSKTEGATGSAGSGRRRLDFVRTVPWWGTAAAVIAPSALISGWSYAADLQPGSFDSVSRSISSLAAYGAADRWVMTVFLIVVAAANAVTGFGLRAAARNGRILLVAGGIFGLLVAASPQPAAGSSIRHVVVAGLSCAAMTAWPLAGLRREPWAPFGLRPGPSIWATGVVSVILAWFCFEVVTGGDMIGLAERTVTGAQTVWPLFVVLTVLAAGRRRLASQPAIARSPVPAARSGPRAAGYGPPASRTASARAAGGTGPAGSGSSSSGSGGSGSARSRPGP